MGENVAYRSLRPEFEFGKDGSLTGGSSQWLGIGLVINTCMGAMEIANAEFQMTNAKNGRYRTVIDANSR